jgi:hypothetical protein
MRDDLWAYVLEHRGDPSGVVVADETGFLKKAPNPPVCSGSTPVPPAGSRIVRLGVVLTYVSTKGRALIDRELYLPETSWCADRECCAEAGIGDEVEFATKLVRAEKMLERLLDSGVEVGWFTADEAYGGFLGPVHDHAMRVRPCQIGGDDHGVVRKSGRDLLQGRGRPPHQQHPGPGLCQSATCRRPDPAARTCDDGGPTGQFGRTGRGGCRHGPPLRRSAKRRPGNRFPASLGRAATIAR